MRPIEGRDFAQSRQEELVPLRLPVQPPGAGSQAEIAGELPYPEVSPDTTALYPLLIQMQFSFAFRPADLAASTDERLISMSIIDIDLLGADGRQLASFNFAGKIPPGASFLYGMSTVEDWGVWNDGQRSAILLSLEAPLAAGDRLCVRYRTPVTTSMKPTLITLCNGVTHPALLLDSESFELLIQPGEPRSSAGLEVPRVSVVIVNHDRADVSVAAAALALSSAACACEVLIVDNGSSEHCWRLLRRFRLPATVIRIEEKTSTGEARNLAVEQASGRYILFLDNDAFLTPQCLDLLVETLDSNVALAAAGPVSFYPDGRLKEAGGFVTTAGRALRRANLEARINAAFLPALSNVDFISTSCVLFRKDTFVVVGGFDPSFELAYCGNIDLCLRAQQLGNSIGLVRDASILHIGDATSCNPETSFPPQPETILDEEKFRSRWQDWSLDRQEPGAIRFPYIEARRFQPQEYSCDSNINVVFIAGYSRAEEEAGVLVAAAMADESRTILVSACPRSAYRFGRMAGDLALDRFGAEVAHLTDISGMSFGSAIFVSGEFPPELSRASGIKARHSLLYSIANDTLLGADTNIIEARIRFLTQIDVLIFDSDRGLEQCSRELRARRAPPMATVTARIPYASFVSRDLAKEDLILLSAVLPQNTTADALLDLIKAFERFRSEGHASWRLILALNASLGFDPDAVVRVENVAVRLGVQLLVNAPEAIHFTYLMRAKIFVSAFESNDHARAWSTGGAGVAQAIRVGCVPIVPPGGGEAEICQLTGAGLLCSGGQELPPCLARAAEMAGTDGLPLHRRQQAERFGYVAFRDAIRGLAAQDSSRRPEEFPQRVGQPTKALVVVGMHRSGTSAMTRVLSLAGAALPKTIMPSNQDNPTGFWEPAEVAELNDRILTSMGLGWDNIFLHDPELLAQLTPANLDAARATLRRNFSLSSLIVLKDPRVSIVTPLWEQALIREGFEPHYVIMTRSPWEVASSLSARSGMPFSTGLLLWSAYMTAVETNTRGRSRTFVRYADLLAQPQATLEAVSHLLGVELRPLDAETKAEIDRFLQPELRRQIEPHGARDPAFAPTWNLSNALESLPWAAQPSVEVFTAAREWLDKLRELVGPTLAHADGLRAKAQSDVVGWSLERQAPA